MSKFSLFLSLSILILLTACSKTSGSGSGEDGDSAITDQDLTVNSDTQEKRFEGGNIPTAESGGKYEDIFFSYDSASIPSDGEEIISRMAKDLERDTGSKVEVEGHCDKRGTAEYNLALGEERAKSVAKALVSQGASPDQISTVSYGEEIPLDPSDSDAAYAKNRRVHFGVGKGGFATTKGKKASPRRY